MAEKIPTPVTPAEFYRMIRPEYFSDSEKVSDVELPKELLSFELERITTNQKQDEFETLCRRLAEKLISPNLIPQVGPTGGGDGKTDSETYPVSSSITERWFIPENGWNNNEKWAFAFSAKKDWKAKLNKDVESILSTKRDYTKIYFIINQTPSSKQKKDLQDELTKKNIIEIIILDGKWIVEKTYSNNLTNLVVDALNLSNVYKSKINVGPNDSERLKNLSELEERINDQNRYFDNDFQLVEDALESAILSRMLEKPKDEIEGKFDRVVRFCKKVNNEKQWIRLHYQRAWTYANYFGDYIAFYEEFKKLKKLINSKATLADIEYYVNLFNLLSGIVTSKNLLIDKVEDIYLQEEKELFNFLEIIISNKNKPCTSLTAQSYELILTTIKYIKNDVDPKKYIKEMISTLRKSQECIDYPFENFKKMIEFLGEKIPSSELFDNLIDTLADISEKRSSKISAGEIFLKRGYQKIEAELYKECIIYFGKAVLKLAKEESQDGMYISLIGLAQAYRQLGLIWASNNCYIAASSISFKSWYESGIINSRSYNCAKQLTVNELFIGRIPQFLTWYELTGVMSRYLDFKEMEKSVEFKESIDGCLAVRILHTKIENEKVLLNLPNLFEEQCLWLTENAYLYKLGYVEVLLKEYKDLKITNKNELDEFYQKLANQPFVNQMIFDTNFMKNEEIHLSSIILGCKFTIRLKKEKNVLLVSEMLLAFLESFLATSLLEIYSIAESINIDVIESENKLFKVLQNENNYNYSFYIATPNRSEKFRDEIWNACITLIGKLLANNFLLENSKDYLENLFKNEEINERTSLIFEYHTFIYNVLGDSPKLFLDDWLESKNFKEYSYKRMKPIEFSPEEPNPKKNIKDKKIRHDNIKIYSIINDKIWNQAKWIGFGYFFHTPFFCLTLVYNNMASGEKIFDEWIERFSRTDEKDEIKITIIRGVNKYHPNWYRVHISNNIDKSNISENQYVFSTSRFHELNANNSQNLDNLIKEFNRYKFYILCPARMGANGLGFEPNINKGILKRSLHIKYAWEIDENDLDFAVIRPDDTPFIPNNVSDAPVLKALQKKKSNVLPRK